MNAGNVYCSIALICMGLVQPVHAQHASTSTRQVCSRDLVGVVGESLKIDDSSFGNAGVIVSDACKVWPKDDAITLVAVAYLASPGVLNLAVAMIENGSNNVIASYQGFLGRQADMRIRRGSLSIDTARYDVTRGIRAFGVDVERGCVADCCESGLGKIRSLYVLDGKEIRPIVEGFYLSYRRSARGGRLRWSSSEDAMGTPAPVIETITLKIAIGKSLTNDYSDLQVFSVSSGDDASRSGREPFQYELKYDGRQYPLNEMNKEYLEWLK